MNNENTAPFDRPKEFPTDALERVRELLNEKPQTIGPYRVIERLRCWIFERSKANLGLDRRNNDR